MQLATSAGAGIEAESQVQQHASAIVLYIYVTRFAKTLQLHTSDFSTLVTHNSRTIKDIAVKFLHIVKQ